MRRYGFEFDITGSAVVYVLAETKEEAVQKLKVGSEIETELNEWNTDYPYEFEKLCDETILSHLSCEDEVDPIEV